MCADTNPKILTKMVIGGTAQDLFSSFYSSVCSKLLLNNERYAHFLPQEPNDAHISTLVLPHLSETKTGVVWFPLTTRAVQLFLFEVRTPL